MSNYYFLLVLMIVISGLYYIKRFSKTLIGSVPLMTLIILVGVCVAKDVTKLNRFVLEPWRFFIITFMGALYYIISKEKIQVDFEEALLVLVTLLGSSVVVTCDHLVVLYLGLES